jgi:hypothetical protein
MVIILNRAAPKKSKWGDIGGKLGLGLGEGLEEAQRERQEGRRLSQENEAAKRLGIDLSQFTDPKMRQILLDNKLNSQQPNYQNQYENENENNFINEMIDEPKEFNYKEPSSWSEREINQLRALESKSPKAKTLSNMAKNEYSRRQESKKEKSKNQEAIAPFNSALEIIDRMKKLGKKNSLGIGSKYKGIIYSDVRKDRAEYERLGKSLIQYSSNIPIRNQQEFETLSHDLYDPNISDASREGILNAMKRIVQSAIESKQMPEENNLNESTTIPSNKKQKRPLNLFMEG